MDPHDTHETGKQESNSKGGSVGFRQVQILSLVKSRGFVTIEQLALAFDVTPQTIRRGHQRPEQGGHAPPVSRRGRSAPQHGKCSV